MSALAAGGLDAFLSRERERVDRALEEVASGALAGVAEWLREPMRYALSTSGKRLRPILCVAAYRAVRAVEPSREPALYRLSCALEVVHTYSLVHDDLPCMDDDDLRRGRPTVHRAFDHARATLAGAALLPLAVEIVLAQGSALGLGEQDCAGLVAELCRAAGAEGMVGGQLLDLQGEERSVDGQGLEAIHRAKTGALLTASLRLGARAAGAPEGVLLALSAYGDALGLAFQITDDVLDVVGNPALLGKTAGRDEALRKASYPSLYGLDGANALARDKAEQAKAALRELDSPELLALADYVVERHH